MRAKLELSYNLNNEEDVRYINDVLRVSNIKSVLQYLDQYLRNIVKYGISENEILADLRRSEFSDVEISYSKEQIEDITKGYIEACSQIRDKLWEFARDENIFLD